MTEFVKKSVLSLLRSINKRNFQRFFENLYLFSLHGMGFGESEIKDSGEKIVLKYFRGAQKVVIFDVGANIGQYSKECLATIKDLALFSFEPSKNTFARLKENIKDERVRLYNFGFGETNKTQTLFFDQEGSGLASVYKRELAYRHIFFRKKEKILIKTIDSFCKKNKIKQIDLLKIDVEGNELNVLKGAKKMLKEKRIKSIQFEFGGCNIDSRVFFKDFWEILSKNYDIFRITSGGLIPIYKYTESNEIFTIINYFARLK